MVRVIKNKKATETQELNRFGPSARCNTLLLLVITQALTNQGNPHWVKHQEQVMEQQAAVVDPNLSGVGEAMEVRGRRRAWAAGVTEPTKS